MAPDPDFINIPESDTLERIHQLLSQLLRRETSREHDREYYTIHQAANLGLFETNAAWAASVRKKVPVAIG